MHQRKIEIYLGRLGDSQVDSERFRSIWVYTRVDSGSLDRFRSFFDLFDSQEIVSAGFCQYFSVISQHLFVLAFVGFSQHCRLFSDFVGICRLLSTSVIVCRLSSAFDCIVGTNALRMGPRVGSESGWVRDRIVLGQRPNRVWVGYRIGSESETESGWVRDRIGSETKSGQVRNRIGSRDQIGFEGLIASTCSSDQILLVFQFLRLP